MPELPQNQWLRFVLFEGRSNGISVKLATLATRDTAAMHGLMMNTPLLISSIAEHAANYHGSREIVSVTVDNPRHRYTYRECVDRSRQLANAFAGLAFTIYR